MLTAEPTYVESSLTFSINFWSSPADGARQGGDWCDAFALSDTRVAVAIFDVSGHGEAVAATMQSMRSIFFVAMRTGLCPSRVLSLANAVACAREESLIITALVGILDGEQREFTFANAGHPPPLLMTPKSHAFLSKPIGDLPLGIFAKHDVTLQKVAVPDDALLVLFTDGLIEHNREIALGEIELIEATRAIYHLPALHLAKTIAHGVLKSGRGVDDITVLAARTRLSR